MDAAWRDWGPYVSERSWGTVREDYGDGETTWDYISHDAARSRAYRWSEDGLAGVCNSQQTWCLALALWNGVDPILKERVFGLTGEQGNHGEDAKDYWWYLDATPTHDWMRWRYHYPQRPFPYDDLVATNAHRGRDEPEYELVDTGVFGDDRFWVVTVDYAKADPHDLCMRITVDNLGPDVATLDVLPTLWFRNTWAWADAAAHEPPSWTAREQSRVVGRHHAIGELTVDVDAPAELLFCDNESNAQRLWGVAGRSAYPKDGINDHIVNGAATVNPLRTGTKVAARYRLTVPPGGHQTVRLRLRAQAAVEPGVGSDFEDVMQRREAEADAFYAALGPESATPDERLVLRQALAGMVWGKQFYRYDVDRWLDGDPAGPPPPPEHLTKRNRGWRHVDARDVISMPDKWEYPWFAAWDLAFHCVTLSHLDAEFAKEQLLLLCTEWYMHPNGQLPAYEWDFSDVNPPVHAWAALEVFKNDDARDYHFLQQVFHKLLLNFTWWVNRKDAQGNNVFEGGFLGLDNIGPIDRSAPPPVAASLEQTDGTAWMGMFCLNMLEIAVILAQHDATYEAMAIKFMEHFAYISTAIYTNGLWDVEDGFFYDVLVTDDGRRFPLKVRSMVGLLPLCASLELQPDVLKRLPDFTARMRWFAEHRPQYTHGIIETTEPDGSEGRLLAIVTPHQLPAILSAVLDEAEFLSPYGLRSMSAHHRDHPFVLDIDGGEWGSVDYEPAESRTALYGGNSNWRGPIWMPVNHLVVGSLRRFARCFGDARLTVMADEITTRLLRLFTRDADGRRAVFGDVELFQTHPAWRDNVPFHEYFDGDTGKGLGASHQTGWTGLIADLLLTPGGDPGHSG